MMTNSENKETEEIGLVTPTPGTLSWSEFTATQLNAQFSTELQSLDKITWYFQEYPQ